MPPWAPPPRIGVKSSILPVVLATLVSCAPALKGPPGQPRFSPVGLWVSHPGPGVTEVLRIVCGERCWFRDVVLYRRDLKISGPVANVTERNGYLLTSADEILQMQTEFRSEQFRLSTTDPGSSTVDRVVYGESRLRLLHFEGSDRLVGDDSAFERRCPAPASCGLPMASVLVRDSTAEPGGQDGRAAAELSLVAVPDMAWLAGGGPGTLLPDDVVVVQSIGAAVLARTHRPPGETFPLASKAGDSPQATRLATLLATVYESRIALSPGGAALLKRKEQSVSPERQRRLDDIRSRLKSGAPVSREEILEVLDGREAAP